MACKIKTKIMIANATNKTKLDDTGLISINILIKSNNVTMVTYYCFNKQKKVVFIFKGIM